MQPVGTSQTARRPAEFVDPLAVDAAIRSAGLEISELRAAIPKELKRISPVRSWLTLLRVLLSSAACIAALAWLPITNGAALFYQLPALALLWVLLGWILVGLFVIGHDCGHGSFSRRPWVNQIVGLVCMAPLLTNLRTWILTHNHHHRYTQLQSEDVTWSANLKFVGKERPVSRIIAFGYRVPYGIVAWILWNTARRATQLRTMISPRVYENNRRTLMWNNLFMLGFVGGLCTALGFTLGGWAIIKFYVAPAIIAMLSGAALISIQHAHERTLFYTDEAWSPAVGQLACTFDVRFPAVLEWLWLHINIHVPHHVQPNIPWYNLQAASWALRAEYGAYYQPTDSGGRLFGGCVERRC